jgi:rubrerythrin
MVCGYVFEGENAPEVCEQCTASQSKFKKMRADDTLSIDEHRIGIAEGVDGDIVESLRQDFLAECTEIALCLASARQAEREGYPEIAMAFEKIAREDAEHAAKYAELLGESVYLDTRRNLQFRANAQLSACEGKKRLATKTRQLNLDPIHDVVHEICKDEARHGFMLRGLIDRYFK